MTPQQPPAPPPRAGDDAPLGRPATGRSSGARWAGGIVLALVLYVLSTGPMLKLTFTVTGQLTYKTCQTIYAPLLWLGETDTGQVYIQPLLKWYWYEIWNCPLDPFGGWRPM